VREMREELLNLCALLEIDLDFSEEGLQVISPSVIAERIERTDRQLAHMADSFGVGRVYRNGVSVALAGRPNAGKSSLLNALLSEERAIVAPHPGTTRDTIEESMEVDGVYFRLTDTAGLREVPESVEAEGVRRAKLSMRGADIVLYVVDASAAGEADMLTEFEGGRHTRAVTALTKADLVGAAGVRQALRRKFGDESVFTSAVTGEGVQEVKIALRRVAVGMEPAENQDPVLISERHYRAVLDARGALANARTALLSGKSNEFVAFDVREGTAALGRITGDVTSDEILNTIFGGFCVGK